MASSDFIIKCPKCKSVVEYDKAKKKCVCPSCKKEVDTSRYKVFNLSNVVVAFSEKTQSYANYRKQVIKDSYKMSAFLEENYRKCATKAEDCAKFIVTICMSSANKFIGMAVEALTKVGVYEYDCSAFIDYYLSRPYVNNKCYALEFQEKMEDFLNGLAGQVDSHEASLQAQDSARGRWSGGGFGLKGALKGAAMAGALNMAEDFGSSVLQSWQRSEFKDRMKRKLVNKFASEDTISEYCASVRADYQNIFAAVYDILAEHGIYHSEQYHLYAIAQNMRGVVTNIKNGLVPPMEAVSALLSLICDNPFCHTAELLEMLYGYIGGSDGEMMRLAEYVGADVEFKSRIFPMINKKNVELLESCKSSADYHGAVEKIREAAKNAGAEPEELECFKKAIGLEEKAKNQEETLERNSRTFKGVVYDTVEEKRAASDHSFEINEAYRDLVEKINSTRLFNGTSTEKNDLNLEGWLDNILFSEIKEWEIPRYDAEIERYSAIPGDPMFEGSDDDKAFIRKYVERLKKYRQKAVDKDARDFQNRRGERYQNSEEGKQDRQRVLNAAELFLKTDFTQPDSTQKFRESVRSAPPSNIGDYNAAADLLSGMSPAELKLLQHYTAFRVKGFGVKVLLKILAGFGVVIGIAIVMTLLRDISGIMTMEQYNDAANALLEIYCIAAGIYLLIGIVYCAFAGERWKTATVGGTLLHPMLQPKKHYIAPSLVIGTKKERKEAKIRLEIEKMAAKKANNGKKPL